MRELFENRYTTARADADAARKTYEELRVEGSRRVLERLLQKSLAERFEALETHKDDLLRSDRRKLVRSVRERRPRKIIVPSGTASGYERWRSKLPYNVFHILGRSVLLGAAFAATIMAYVNTPQKLVELDISEVAEVRERLPDGEIRSHQVRPGELFPLMRFDGDDAILRDWIVGEGYAEIRLLKTALKNP